MSVNLLQHPSLRLSISKSQTLRPQRIQGKNCYFIASEWKSQPFALLWRCFSLALRVVGSPYFWALKHSFTMVLLLQSCQAFQQPNDDLQLTSSIHPTRCSAPAAPLSRGLLGKACWLACQQQPSCGPYTSFSTWWAHAECSHQLPQKGKWSSSVLQPRQKSLCIWNTSNKKYKVISNLISFNWQLFEALGKQC